MGWGSYKATISLGVRKTLCGCPECSLCSPAPLLSFLFPLSLFLSLSPFPHCLNKLSSFLAVPISQNVLTTAYFWLIFSNSWTLFYYKKLLHSEVLNQEPCALKAITLLRISNIIVKNIAWLCNITIILAFYHAVIMVPSPYHGVIYHGMCLLHGILYHDIIQCHGILHGLTI